jgi:hypothetical protein
MPHITGNTVSPLQNTSGLLVFSETIDVFTEDHTKHIHTLHGKNTFFAY